MKLYKRVSRFLVRRHVHKWAEKRIKWAMSLQPGDIINDCTSLNVVVRDVHGLMYPVNNGWYIYDVDIDLEPFGGSCSLMHCGVELPKTREVLEKDYMQYMKDYMSGEGPGSAAYWFGGRDTEDFKKAEKGWFSKLEAIQNGGHFLDERGVLLPEFRLT